MGLFIANFAMQYYARNRGLGEVAAVSRGKFYIDGGADFSRATALNHRNHGHSRMTFASSARLPSRAQR